ncbi:hypothetical protein [Pontibacter arcticus]|uniref:Outer membrane protein beta-barrel domain-containing protein n=1 Tax=Pontibacter arcticus TaxID=2080288 RepID=A0A364RED5_9BACT|nr:hypothetical protein [Pontibacter arcticus]RAU82642.1 hypothetical protein DP923_10300 [Pontibacter arcticus]
MKNFIRFTFTLAFMLSLALGAQAQSGYSTGIGFRGGAASGLTVKHFIKSDAAIEGILSSSFRYRGATVTVLYEKHAQAFNTSGLQWYYGLGGHLGFYEGRYYYHKKHKRYDEHYHDNVVGFGIDGILGLEYYLKDIPFTVGADIKPYINIPSGGGYWDSALHVRYVF